MCIMDKQVLVHAEGLHKYFGATKAVDDVTVDFYRGKVCGIVGENGSGKSTLLSLLSGIHKKDRGEIYLDGKKYEPRHLTDANRHGVSMIVQEANTIPGLTVAENMFLGIENEFTERGIRNIKKMNALAKARLEEIGLGDIDPEHDVSCYSMEQRKLIELVKAAMIKAKLLMIDETSTALSQTGRDMMYKLIADTKNRGDSVLLISHDLQEVLKYCDRIVVMRDGKKVAEVSTAGLDEAELKKLMVGRELSGKYYRDDFNTPVSGEVTLNVEHLSCGKKLKDVSFQLHRGEILGIGGLSESGMHELGKALFGIEYDVGGKVTVANGDIIRSIKDSIAHNIGYISKNRDTESLFNNADITDNICVTCMDNLASHGFVSFRKMRRFAGEKASLLNIKMRDLYQKVGTLSGGNKQKVVLTKWIARGTEIFIMDSPTRGIDVGVKSIIYTMLDDLRKQGKSIILISEELLELIGMSDRIIILKDGEISKTFERDPGLSEEKLVQYMV